MSNPYRSSLMPVGALLLSLVGCSVDTPASPVGDAFTDGSPEELALAEDIGYEHLFAASGPADLKGVDELRTMKVTVDETQMAHVRVQQLLNGVPVFGGEAIAHLTPEAKLASITDDLVPNVAVDTTPLYDADDAMDIAAEEHFDGWGALTDDPTATLYVLRHEGVDHLAWRVQLSRIDGVTPPTMPVMFIDAHTGELVWQYENLQTATCTGTTPHYGTVSVDCNLYSSSYYLEDTTDLIGTYTWNNGTSSLSYVSSTSTTMGTTTVTQNAVEAHYTLQKVYDYYRNAHGRTGIDGAGGPGSISSHGYSFITSTTSYSRNYVNAFWDSSALRMVYGDGDGTNSGSLTTLDIGGHELTHGVTQYEANLTYSGESGGLNESMSDVFGEMVERSVLGESSNTWKVGEETWTPSTSGDALRYMNDPAADGYSYDYYTSSISSGDVHYTSGVGNLAFYLLSAGGTHPRGKSTTSVTGIGADAAAQIWYLALSSYMTSSTTYSGARTATLSAAAALYGSTSNEYTQVGNAWTAVGVGGSSGGGGSTACTTSSYSGSLSRRGKSSYQPSSSGTAVSATSQTLSLTGPSSADFDLYLQVASGSSWSTVASSTGSTSTEAISYSGSTGTYRVLVYSYSGSGSYSLSWCK